MLRSGRFVPGRRLSAAVATRHSQGLSPACKGAGLIGLSGPGPGSLLALDWPPGAPRGPLLWAMASSQTGQPALLRIGCVRGLSTPGSRSTPVTRQVFATLRLSVRKPGVSGRGGWGWPVGSTATRGRVLRLRWLLRGLFSFLCSRLSSALWMRPSEGPCGCGRVCRHPALPGAPGVAVGAQSRPAPAFPGLGPGLRDLEPC